MRAMRTGLPYYDIFGRKHTWYPDYLRVAFTHPYTYVFMGIVVLLFVVLDAYELAEKLPLWLAVLYWSSVVLTQVVLYAGLLLLCTAYAKRHPGFIIYFPLFGVVSMTLNTFLAHCNSHLLTGDPVLLKNILREVPVNILLGLVFETMYMLFTFPVVMMTNKTLAKARTVKSVAIAGRMLQADELLAVRADGHFVEITSTSGTIRLKSRMSDALTQLEHLDGIVPHRSYWVARHGVEGLEWQNANVVLLLKSGTRIPVARGRLEQVEKWLAEGDGPDRTAGPDEI